MKTTKVVMQLTGLGRVDDHYVVMGERYHMGKPEMMIQRVSEQTYNDFQRQLADAGVEMTEETVPTTQGEGYIDRMPSADDITARRAFAVVSGRTMIEKSGKGRIFTLLDKSIPTQGVLEGPKLDIAVEVVPGRGAEWLNPRRKRISTLEALAYKVRGNKARIRMGRGHYKPMAELSQA